MSNEINETQQSLMAVVSNDETTIKVTLSRAEGGIEVLAETAFGSEKMRNTVFPPTSKARREVSASQVKSLMTPLLKVIGDRPWTLSGMTTDSEVDPGFINDPPFRIVGGPLEIATFLMGPASTLYEGGDTAEWTTVETGGVGATSWASGAEDDEDALYLSNGERFYPRVVMTIEGVPITDVMLLRKIWEEGEDYPLLIGPGGAGKTSLVEVTSDKQFNVVVHPETTTLTIYGRYAPSPADPGNYFWLKSELVQSILYAQDHLDETVVCYFDEIMQMNIDVQTALHSLFDHRRTLFIEEGEFVGELVAPSNWKAVFSSNPDEVGSDTTGPFGSRLMPIPYLTNWDAVRRAIGRGKGHEALITAAMNMEARRRNEEVNWAPQMRHLVKTAKRIKFLGLDYGIGLLINQCALETKSPNSDAVHVLKEVLGSAFRGTNVTIEPLVID